MEALLCYYSLASPAYREACVRVHDYLVFCCDVEAPHMIVFGHKLHVDMYVYMCAHIHG